MNPNQKCLEIIKKFNLSPQLEGGLFKEIVRRKTSLTMAECQIKDFITGFIIFLREMQKRAWHRLKNADEILIYLRRDSLNLWCLDDDNNLIRNKI